MKDKKYLLRKAKQRYPVGSVVRTFSVGISPYNRTIIGDFQFDLQGRLWDIRKGISPPESRKTMLESYR